MHSIARPSSPAFLTISSLIASPTPCCPFLPLTMLQSPLKKTRYPVAQVLEVPSLLVSCNPMTPQPFAAQVLSRVVDVADTVDAVDRCCANVEHAERELLQPRPRPDGLVVLAGGLPPRPLPPSPFSSKCPSPLTQFQVFPTQVLASDMLGAVIIPPRLDFSIVDTVAYSRVPSEHSSSPRFGSHVFRGGGVPTLLPQARLPRETILL